MSSTSSPVTFASSVIPIGGGVQPKSFILRNCACCSDQPIVPPDCPACHGAGGFTGYMIAEACGSVSVVVSPPTPAGG